MKEAIAAKPFPLGENNITLRSLLQGERGTEVLTTVLFPELVCAYATTEDSSSEHIHI